MIQTVHNVILSVHICIKVSGLISRRFNSDYSLDYIITIILADCVMFFSEKKSSKIKKIKKT